MRTHVPASETPQFRPILTDDAFTNAAEFLIADAEARTVELLDMSILPEIARLSRRVEPHD